MKRLAIVFALAACAPRIINPGQDGAPTAQVDEIRFDGVSVSLRLLVGASSGVVAIDRRLVENVHFTINEVRSCSDGTFIRYVMEDYFPSPPASDDVLLLDPGYWYGSNLKFTVFKQRTACADATFVFWAGFPNSVRLAPIKVHLEIDP